MKAFAPLLMLAALAPPALAQAPSPQGAVIAEALDYYCTDWLAAADTAPPPANAQGAAAGWREARSAAPAVGPIMVKGGEWGRASLVRVSQSAGHRCSISMQLAATDWTTEAAHAAVSDWTAKTWPGAAKVKARDEGPRGTRESVWQSGPLTLTLQESPDPGAQPNVFITLQNQREI